MHDFRAALGRGEAANILSLVVREKCRRRAGSGGIATVLVPRAEHRSERRHADQRREARYRGIAERATLHFRRKTMLVKLVNLSAGGAMIEASVVPRIGEIVAIDIAGFELVAGAVRWVRAGRIGVDFGEGALTLP